MKILKTITCLSLILAYAFGRPSPDESSSLEGSFDKDELEFGPDFIPYPENTLTVNASQDTSANTTTPNMTSRVRQNNTIQAKNVIKADSPSTREMLRKELRDMNQAMKNRTAAAFDYFDPSELLRPHGAVGVKKTFWDVSGVRRVQDLMRTGVAVAQSALR